MNKRASQTVVGGVDLGRLIERLGPLNNRWRDGGAAEKALTLWEMGEALLASTPEPSDALLWEIQSRSYVTRNVLRYALIVRRGWPERSQLAPLTRGLRSFTVFREALPFLKGEREGIDEATHRRVASLLSDADTQAAVEYFKTLKARKIGRRHRKGAGVAAIHDQAVTFSRALAQLEAEAAANPASVGSVPAEATTALSQLAMAVATGETTKTIPDAASVAGDKLAPLAEPLTAAVRGGRAASAALRKAVGAERLMQAADLFNSLRSQEALAEWRRRCGSRLAVASNNKLR
jgi:hypothetical protein